jgi:hypothetical protein
VKVYCPAHNEVEEFTSVELERVAYTLSAMVVDAETEEKVDGDPYDRFDCLTRVLNASYDGEQYAEHAGALIERRRAAAREANRG